MEYMKEQWVGRLATVSKRQTPQLTPVGFAADEHRVYMNIKHDSKKARNIRVNPRVSFVVDDFPSWEVIRGVSIRGRAKLVSGGELHETGKTLIYEKYPRYEAEYGVGEDGCSKYILVNNAN